MADRAGSEICEYIRKDCCEALIDFIQQGRQFDALIIVNEGLREGGGRYALHSPSVVGLLCLVVCDRYLHIAAPEYYRKCEWPLWDEILDFPFESTEIGSGHPEYLTPRHISNSNWRDVRQWIMSRSPKSRHFRIGDFNCALHHMSIWEHRECLDMIVVPKNFRCWFSESLDRLTDAAFACIDAEGSGSFQCPGVLRFKGIPELLRHCEKSRLLRVGFMPWARGKYATCIDELGTVRTSEPFKLGFYHLNSNDYSTLYAYANRTH